MNIADYIMFICIGLAVFYGIKKGFIKMIVNLLSSIAAFLIAVFSARAITAAIRDFSIFDGFRKGIQEFFTNNADLVNKNVRQAVESIALPEFIKNSLLKDFPDPSQTINAGAQALAERVFDLILLGIVCIALFIVVRIAFCFLETILEKILGKIKILDAANKVLGGVMGFADAVLILYFALAVITLLASRFPGLVHYVTDSEVVSKLYFNNLLLLLLA